MTSLQIFFLAVLGLIVGSFINVVAYRIPRGESLLAPPSHCRACQERLAWCELVPVVSWFALGGHCRHCHQKISPQYPLTEIGVSVLSVAVGLRSGWHLDLLIYLFFGWALVALATMDAQHLVLPRRIIYPVTAIVLGWLVIAAQVTHQLHRLFVAVIWGLAWWGLFALLRLFNNAWMGGGDVRLAFSLGLVLGWWHPGSVLLAFFSANVLGAVVGSLLISSGRKTRKDPVPFGLYLALGAAVGFFLQPYVVTQFPLFAN